MAPYNYKEPSGIAAVGECCTTQHVAAGSGVSEHGNFHDHARAEEGGGRKKLELLGHSSGSRNAAGSSDMFQRGEQAT